MYRDIWCFWRRDVKASPALYSRQETRHKHWLNVTCFRKVYSRPCDILVLGQRRRRLTAIEPAIGCIAGPTLNRNSVGRPTSSVPGTS